MDWRRRRDHDVADASMDTLNYRRARSSLDNRTSGNDNDHLNSPKQKRQNSARSYTSNDNYYVASRTNNHDVGDDTDRNSQLGSDAGDMNREDRYEDHNGFYSPLSSNRSYSPHGITKSSQELSPSQRPPAGLSTWKKAQNSMKGSHSSNASLDAGRTTFEYVPHHLHLVNYKNDIFEVLKDKIDQHSNSFHQSFKRLNKSIGYQGWCVRKEDFRQALIKDFHLFEEIPPGESIEHREIKRYQDEQKRKLDEFLNEATSSDGYIRYSDFIRAVKGLDKRVNVMSTTAERQARYSSTMSNQANAIIANRMSQMLEKGKLKPPPFALYDESEKYEQLYFQRYKDRLDALRGSFGHFDVMNNHERVPYEVFKQGLLKFDRYMTEREVNEMYKFLDPKKTGFVDVGEFMDRFAVQILNNKSLRGTCETGYTHMQWPRSLIEVRPRSAELEHLREKSSKHVLKAKSRGTRTVHLRKDKIERDAIQHLNQRVLSNTGFLSQEQRNKADLPFYRHRRPSSASATRSKVMTDRRPSSARYY